MLEDESADCELEFINNRFTFTISTKRLYPPSNDGRHHFISFNKTFRFPHFKKYFGPPSLFLIYNYWSIITGLLVQLPSGTILHHWVTMAKPEEMANSAVLIGSYAILFLEMEPCNVFKILTDNGNILYKNFCDTTTLGGGELSLEIILKALHMFAKKMNFFNIFDFDVDEMRFLGRKNTYCNLSWIVPGKFIAFCGPQSDETVTAELINYFKSHDVKAVVRCNEAQYDARMFLNHGIHLLDLPFEDCMPPCTDKVMRFLSYVDLIDGVIAVHCKAGLGRTGTLIAIYLVSHYRVPPLEAVAWIRLCRPGSIVGNQLQYLLQTCHDYGEQRQPLPITPYPIYSLKAAHSDNSHELFRCFYRIINSMQL